MRQHDYDLLLGQSLDTFGLQRLLAGHGFAAHVTFYGDAATGRPAFRAEGYTWQLYDLDAQGLFLSCTFDARATVLTQGRRAACQGLRLCFYLRLDELLRPGAFNWVEVLNTFDESDADELLVQDLKEELRKKLLTFKPLLSELLLKPGRQLDQDLHPTVTSTVAFLQKNERQLYASYLCIGQMLDQRLAPAQYGFPASLTRDAPAVVCRLSPYAYLKLGLSQHLAAAYPGVEFVFNATGTECRMAPNLTHTATSYTDLGTRNTIAIPHEAVRKSLPDCGQIDTALVTELVFAVRKEHVTVACGGQVDTSHVPATVGLGRMSLWQMTQPLPVVHTTYLFNTKSYFELCKRPNGELDVVEDEVLREQHNGKHVTGSEWALALDGLERNLTQALLSAFTFLTPFAAAAAVTNPFLGCVLFIVCSATAQLVNREVQAHASAEQLRQIIALHDLRLSFADMLPFKVPHLEIDQFRFDDGLLLTAHVARELPPTPPPAFAAPLNLHTWSS